MITAQCFYLVVAATMTTHKSFPQEDIITLTKGNSPPGSFGVLTIATCRSMVFTTLTSPLSRVGQAGYSYPEPPSTAHCPSGTSRSTARPPGGGACRLDIASPRLTEAGRRVPYSRSPKVGIWEFP